MILVDDLEWWGLIRISDDDDDDGDGDNGMMERLDNEDEDASDASDDSDDSDDCDWRSFLRCLAKRMDVASGMTTTGPFDFLLLSSSSFSSLSPFSSCRFSSMSSLDASPSSSSSLVSSGVEYDFFILSVECVLRCDGRADFRCVVVVIVVAVVVAFIAFNDDDEDDDEIGSDGDGSG